MNIPKYIPYGTQDINNEDIKAVNDVLKSDFLTQGPEIKKFEEAISAKVNAKYSLACNSATSALHMACMALNLSEGDTLWTSPNTFVASANCALYCKANIDFVDINPKTFNICIEKLHEKLIKSKKNGTLPKILVIVHLTGRPCELDEISKLSKKYNFKIIEDASHAIGAEYKKSPIGSCKWSDITVFSFHPVKIITSGEGGMLTTNNKKLYERLSLFRTHGITKDSKNFKSKASGLWHYEQHLLGYNYRMTDIHAALGRSQLKRIDTFIKKRNDLAITYNSMLKNLSLDLPLLSSKNNLISSFHLYVIRLKEIEDIKRHAKIFKYLRDKGIGVNLHYTPVHLHPYYRSIGFKVGDYPEAELYGKSAISIPIHNKLTKKMQSYVVESIASALNN
tara:strand:- start:8499 stop:9680 length:1182 start_codon:yes stop_codon:yes gene_type:complete